MRSELGWVSLKGLRESYRGQHSFAVPLTSRVGDTRPSLLSLDRHPGGLFPMVCLQGLTFSFELVQGMLLERRYR